jgi:cytidine deaminase
MGMTSAEKKSLCAAALAVRQAAYAPYSAFLVGAAVLCEDGAIVAG